ncbi:MAG: hypothetical protein LUE06_01170 [Oscillospiraceae bacterium]|nr:hypothetical protein [Oscillospiraceae bacterium]
MKYEIGADVRHAVIDDTGVHITEKNNSRFLPFDKIVAVSVKKPGAITAGNIFFQTAADRTNSLNSRNIIPFRGNEQYRLACEIQAAVEKII